MPIRGPGGLRAWLPMGTDLRTALGGVTDPDFLLTRPECRVIKLQRKVIVGHVVLGARALFVKRYNVHAPRVALGALFRPSAAVRAYRTAAALARLGFAVPGVVAAMEFRPFGLLARSFFVTDEVTPARTADEQWRVLSAAGPAARARRRAFLRGLGTLFARLHAAGVYHNDLKDVNVLVRERDDDFDFVLLDLERVRIGRSVRRARRVKNLVQIDRTLGRLASRAHRLRFLHAYLQGQPAGAHDRAARRAWVGRVLGRSRRKERGRAAPAATARPAVSCTIVCQNEASKIRECLDSVRWCEEVIVVDGGSTDDTADLARAWGARVLHNRWPGFRAQKQFALDAATSPWVLNLDADERITNELATAIDTALRTAGPDVHGFTIPRLVGYLGRWWWRGGWYPRPILRLVRREVTTWGGTDPHERPEVPGRVEALREPMLHYTYRDTADHLRAVRLLTQIAVAQVPRGRPTGVVRFLVQPGWRLLRSYVLTGGLFDGLPGVLVASTDAFYAFLRCAAVWERDRRAC
jgi:hypothetical protein